MTYSRVTMILFTLLFTFSCHVLRIYAYRYKEVSLTTVCVGKSKNVQEEFNDLLHTLSALGLGTGRCNLNHISTALEKAQENSSVLILSQYDSVAPIFMSSKHLDLIVERNLKVFAEFSTTDSPAVVNTSVLERLVVPNESSLIRFGFTKLSIMDVHSTNYTRIKLHHKDKEEIAIAKVAGYDEAVYGLPSQHAPALVAKDLSHIKIHKKRDRGYLLMSTLHMSRFITYQYAPYKKWKMLWGYILMKLGILEPKSLGYFEDDFHWKPLTHPMYTSDQKLPDDAELITIEKGVNFFRQFMPDSKLAMYLAKTKQKYGDNIVPPLAFELNSNGLGLLGIIEGFSSSYDTSGKNLLAINFRNDCASESSMAFSVASLALKETDEKVCKEFKGFGKRLLNFAWGLSGYRQTWIPGIGDVLGDSMGLLSWSNVNSYGLQRFYTDDDARSILAGFAVRAAQNSDQWDPTLIGAILANFRVNGKSGFSGDCITFSDIQSNGWEYYHNMDRVSMNESDIYSPHYQGYIWAVYFKTYSMTGYEAMYVNAYNAVNEMMSSYPRKWIPTLNGITMQRARMMLPLAWLVRTGKSKHARVWLSKIADGLLQRQHPCGAIQEEISADGWASAAVVPNNDNYGTFEAPLNQNNSDPVSDMLYTNNFAFLGLYEAWHATGNVTFLNAVNKLADFFVRIQTSAVAQNSSLPKRWDRSRMEGGFYRAFDFDKWEVYASDADIGWGAWSIETGWTQTWITTVFSLRAMNVSLWDFIDGNDNTIANVASFGEEFNAWLPVFFPEK